MAPKRYSKLLPLVAETKPKTILEIGTWSGDRAIQLATEALKYNRNVHYIGYDLFEDATPETDKEELNVKKHFTVEEVKSKLEKFKKQHPGFTFDLYKGNTRQTLNEQSVDFAYIDGGHSVETIQNDFEAVKNSRMIVFDDYYLKDEDGKIPNVDKFGANTIVDQLNATVYDSTDKVKEGGYVAIAVYSKR